MSDIIVEVDKGKLRGKICETPDNSKFYSFKGIPYAKPPVGDLRFSVPVPPEAWDEIRDATKDCNICSQLDRATNTIVGDEDCLYLNVYTPMLPSTNSSILPVMVFIHGGGFVYGNGTDDKTHGPDYLVQKEVVVVSFNYRLGVLGFLSLDHKDAPGNMGLRDQVLALKWVQRNIMKFGGDPKNVTIFGFSAGAASVEYLMLSRTAEGLFHKAIAQSGSSLLPWAHNNELKQLSHKIPEVAQKTIQTDEEILKYLKSLPIKELILLSMKVIESGQMHGGIYFGFVPAVEKKAEWETFLDEKPYDLLSQGKFNKVPIITGFCSREGLLMAFYGTQKLEKLMTENNFLDYLPFEIPESDKTNLDSKIKNIYCGIEPKYGETDTFGIDFFSDVDFFGGGYVATSLIAKHNSPVYFYEFDYDGGLNYLKKKYNIERKGACHGDDGGYLIRCDAILGKSVSKTDELVRDRLLEMWTNFAKHGNPTPNINNLITTKWEPATETSLPYLYIDENLVMKRETELYPSRAKLFTELYAKYNRL
ncbi:unnamed protein product [Diatraea saccharalis]|uniref:Carboxylic ester hydrolase n=1 Tax=Diatraea saccharalis TaxID=40085 RepID=A0A9N9RAM5_9NEOP|nr:unnamed protein product [Diatraea saccharalis]